MLRNLPTDQVSLRADARPLDDASISALADSIAEVGLINPIRVRDTGDGWEVIAGAHRLAAVKSLGLVEIAADVVSEDDLHAELAMIDENLCRWELSPADRAKQTARRRAIYQQLHPETKRGGNHKGAPIDTKSFTEQTAKATGRSEQTVYREASRGDRILDEVLDLVRGTPLDTGSYLDRLAKLPGSEQSTIAKRDLAHLKAQARQKNRKVIRIADAPLDGEDAKERQVAALMSAWNKAGTEARQEFLERIDTPVFDRSAA